MGDSSWLDWAELGADIWQGSENADAAEEGSEAQSDALRQALALQREMWETGRADMAPWLADGRQALGNIGALDNGDFSAFTKAPAISTAGIRPYKATSAAQQHTGT